RGHGVVGADAELVEVIEREQLLVVAFFGLRGDQLGAELVDLLAQFVALAFVVERVAEPPEQVTDRLQRLVRAVLNRRDDAQERALHAVQAAAAGLAEVGRQQQQREDDEQREHRATTPDSLVIHLGDYLPSSSEENRPTEYPRGEETWLVAIPRAGPSPAPAVAGGAVGAVDRLELLQRAARADRDAGQRGLGEMRGHLRLLAQALVEALKQRAPAGQHDAAVHDVGGELRRRAVERLLDRVDDLAEGLLERLADLLAGQHDRLRQPRDHVAAADLGLQLLGHRARRADLELQLLGRLLADQQLVLFLGVVDDRLVHLVPADADRLRDDDPAERDHGDLGGAAADVDDHRAGRLAHRQPGADRRGHRLLDQVGGAGSGRQARLLDGALLDAGHARGHAHDDARVGPAVLVDLLDEVAEHLLGHVEVGDHAVLQRPNRLNRPGCAAEHALGLDPDSVNFAGARVDRDDARLGQNDAAAAHVDERVGGAEVDRHVAAAESGQVAEDAHVRGGGPAWTSRGALCAAAPGGRRSRGAHRSAQSSGPPPASRKRCEANCARSGLFAQLRA